MDPEGRTASRFGAGAAGGGCGAGAARGGSGGAAGAGGGAPPSRAAPSATPQRASPWSSASTRINLGGLALVRRAERALDRGTRGGKRLRQLLRVAAARLSEGVAPAAAAAGDLRRDLHHLARAEPALDDR